MQWGNNIFHAAVGFEGVGLTRLTHTNLLTQSLLKPAMELGVMHWGNHIFYAAVGFEGVGLTRFTHTNLLTQSLLYEAMDNDPHPHP